jgi:hypothetical protein
MSFQMSDRTIEHDIDIIEAKVWELQSILRKKGWEYLGSGRHRIVYRSPHGNKVIKIAHCKEGVMANKEEWDFSQSSDLLAKYLPHCPGIQVAKVFGLGVTKKLSILCMEWVNQHSVKLDECPFWVKNVDAFQVGYNHDGKIVAFDFSAC